MLFFVPGMASWYALHAAGKPDGAQSFIHWEQLFPRLVLPKCAGHVGMACESIAPCCRIEHLRATIAGQTILMSSDSAQTAAGCLQCHMYILGCNPSRRGASTLQTARRHGPAHLCCRSKAAVLSSFSLRHMSLHH